MKKKKSIITSKKYKKSKTPIMKGARRVKKEDPTDSALNKLLTQNKTTEKQPKGKEKIHYVNGKEFEEEIRSYYKTGHITQKLGESLTKIANGLSYAPNFINYSYKDDMIGDAIVKMFSALRNKKFKLDTGFSPFSYFTTIAFHAFINRIKKENKHHEVLNEYKEKVYTDHMIDPEKMGGAHIYVEPSACGNDEDNYNSIQ